MPSDVEGRPTGRPHDRAPDTVLVAPDRFGLERCGSCGGRVTPRCTICRGRPDPSVTVEEMARWRSTVDRSTPRALVHELARMAAAR